MVAKNHAEQRELKSLSFFGEVIFRQHTCDGEADYLRNGVGFR